jgi:hypothetical protein
MANFIHQRMVLPVLIVIVFGACQLESSGNEQPDLRVGASAVNLQCDETMVLGGMLEARFSQEQEGELRAVAVVVEKPGGDKIAIVSCDVLWIPRDLVEAALAQIAKTTAIPASHVMVSATHTHHAPSTAPAHAFGSSEPFRDQLRQAIVLAVGQANSRLSDGAASFYFQVGDEHTVGANSRLLLDDGNITWLNPLAEAGDKIRPTGPFDPELPVLEFRKSGGLPIALIFNHSTHTIGTRAGRDIRSPSFYGLAAQELEQELGGVVCFLEGASGSTHNVTRVPVGEAVERMKHAVRMTRSRAELLSVQRIGAIKREFRYRVRSFDEAEEDNKVIHYASRHAPAHADRIREIFAKARRELRAHQGEERTTWVQAIAIGDVAIVGVPAEYFTALGLRIKRNSPFKHTYVSELANDWIGYLPDRAAHQLGGYQTWTGLHSYAEIGTGERVADAAVEILHELHGSAAGAGPHADAR